MFPGHHAQPQALTVQPGNPNTCAHVGAASSPWLGTSRGHPPLGGKCVQSSHDLGSEQVGRRSPFTLDTDPRRSRRPAVEEVGGAALSGCRNGPATWRAVGGE